MLVDHDDPIYVDFTSDFGDYFNSLPGTVFSNGFADSTPAPPAFNSVAEQTWANNYESWYNGLNSTHLANGMYSGGGGTSAPPPPPH